jgi:phospholipase C
LTEIRGCCVSARRLLYGAGILAALAGAGGFVSPLRAQMVSRDSETTTPIKHVIVILGENRSFDHIFATYRPRPGQSVWNLLSRGIVQQNGKPGRNYSWSTQYYALDNAYEEHGLYSISPWYKTPYITLPPAMTGGSPTRPSDTSAPFRTIRIAEVADAGLPKAYERYLLTGASGLPPSSVDRRVTNATYLRDGVFQLTGPKMPYDAYTASPVHRFFQMWQQEDCSIRYVTESNPSGCQHDLFPWVETTVGSGSDGQRPPTPFNNRSTGEGSAAMGFFNMAEGDASYLKYLADHYTLNDNFHQSVMGGTMANHLMFGFADAVWYSDGYGNPLKPPTNLVENPDPQPGTNNYYKRDGYNSGSYVNCSDRTQPGVAAIVNYLQSLNRPVEPNCEPGHYYLVNNFSLPPVTQRSIGNSLSEAKISWMYYGEDWDIHLAYPQGGNPYDDYCDICDPFEYQMQMISDPAAREAHFKDTWDLYTDLHRGTLPAVSIVKPSSLNDGHPESSKVDLFEGFVRKIVDSVQANPKVWGTTAIFITMDESGGYYDSGYIEPIDFFGDGPRIPLIVVSPYSAGGIVSHEYGDHVSITKFIERNWGLQPISSRSRDNLPNPKYVEGDPYVPVNSPALSDLIGEFRF